MTSRAYSDADPGLVCPTAAAVMTHCCCRCRTSVQVVVAPATRTKLFLLDKTCEMQIFSSSNYYAEFQAENLDKTCQVLGVLHSFYPSTCPAQPVSVPILQSLRDPSSVVTAVQIFVFKLICRISRWKSGYTRLNPVFATDVCVLLCFHIAVVAGRPGGSSG